MPYNATQVCEEYRDAARSPHHSDPDEPSAPVPGGKVDEPQVPAQAAGTSDKDPKEAQVTSAPQPDVVGDTLGDDDLDQEAGFQQEHRVALDPAPYWYQQHSHV